MPLFVLPAVVGLYALVRHNVSLAEDQLDARVGNLTGRIASALEMASIRTSASADDFGQSMLSLGQADLAILCLELRDPVDRSVRLSAPPRLGCTQTHATQTLRVPVFFGASDGDLVVMWTRAELADVWTRQLGLSAAVLLAALAISITASFFAFRVIVGRPLSALIAEIEAARVDAEFRALHDPLTALPNRLSLDQHLAGCQGRHDTTVIRIDLDYFKWVNDTFGHAAGDQVLRRVADILRAELRSNDFAARVGGDEFVIVCGPGQTEDDARALAARICSRGTTPVEFGGKQLSFSASFGIAHTDTWDCSTDDLLGFADAALYAAKSERRGSIAAFQPRDR
ncbi:MAG: GGDEF domain-containing protein, partial [Pseudomonadota bacterium]